MSRRILAADPLALELAAEALQRGEVIGIPTETVYGLAVLPLADPLDRLIEIKRRATDKGIQLLVDSITQARQVAVFTPAAEQLAERFWPGGLTLVLDRRPDVDLPLLLGGGRPTLGVRLPDHAVPRGLARRLGPLGASSANISGQPPATTAELLDAALGDELALILDDGPVRGGLASTVIDCSTAGGASSPPRILREGAIPAELINRALARGYTQD